MNEKSVTDKNVYEQIRRLTVNLRRRYCHYDDLRTGLLTLLAGQKLIKSYYRKNRDVVELREWRELIKKNLTEFIEDLDNFKIDEE